MAKDKHVSETPATQFLKKSNIAFTEHPYEYVDHGGAMEAAKQLGLDLHQVRSEEHTSELQSLMRISYAVFCLKKKNNTTLIPATCITRSTNRLPPRTTD